MPAPAIDLTWEGVSSAQSGCGCLPPDTNGDVSDQHYIEWVNTRWAVYDKTDGSVVQAADERQLVLGRLRRQVRDDELGRPDCAVGSARAALGHEPVRDVGPVRAVRRGLDHRPIRSARTTATSSTWPNFGDYPKLAVWTDDSGSQDAYLLTTHEFTGQNFDGAAFIAIERDAMVAGDPTPAMVRFAGNDAYGVEPINLVGQMNAPANACAGFTHFDANTSDYLFWDLCLDWATPGNTTISADPTRIAGTPFVPYFDEVPQQGSAAGLDPFGTHIMYRANARAFPADAPTRVSLVVNHVVQGAVQQGGVNWIHFNLDDHGQTFTTPTPLDKTLLAGRRLCARRGEPLDGRHRDRRQRQHRRRLLQVEPGHAPADHDLGPHRPKIRRARSKTRRTAPTASATARRRAPATAGATIRR